MLIIISLGRRRLLLFGGNIYHLLFLARWLFVCDISFFDGFLLGGRLLGNFRLLDFVLLLRLSFNLGFFILLFPFALLFSRLFSSFNNRFCLLYFHFFNFRLLNFLLDLLGRRCCSESLTKFVDLQTVLLLLSIDSMN